MCSSRLPCFCLAICPLGLPPLVSLSSWSPFDHLPYSRSPSLISSLIQYTCGRNMLPFPFRPPLSPLCCLCAYNMMLFHNYKIQTLLITDECFDNITEIWNTKSTTNINKKNRLFVFDVVRAQLCCWCYNFSRHLSSVSRSCTRSDSLPQMM